jgi:hypothetical protein
MNELLYTMLVQCLITEALDLQKLPELVAISDFLEGYPALRESLVTLTEDPDFEQMVVDRVKADLTELLKLLRVEVLK